MRIMDWVMRVVLWTLTFSVILYGCTTINIITQRLERLSYVDSALVEYTSRFVVEGSKRSINVNTNRLTLVFGKTSTKESPSTVGTCEPVNGYPVVTIDTAYWSVSNDLEKEELVFHELGHCLLDRDHCEEKENGAPVSLMEPEMLGSKVYGERREAFVDELFTPDERCGLLGKNVDGVHVRTRQQ